MQPHIFHSRPYSHISNMPNNLQIICQQTDVSVGEANVSQLAYQRDVLLLPIPTTVKKQGYV